MHLAQDFRYAMRGLRRSPGFAAVAIITLALGIGANTAMFSVIEAVLLRPLPFANPGQLVRMYETEAAPGTYPFTGPDFLDWKAQNRTFQDMTLFGWGNALNLSGAGSPEHVVGMPTEANFFSLLGARPLLGRTWAPGEDQPGREQVAILSYGLWQSRFGGDANVINRVIELNSRKYTVIGVMPPSFRYPARAQLWIPLLMDSKSLGSRGSHSFNGVGRLKPGVSLAQAQADVALIAGNLEKQYPDSNYKVGAALVDLHEALVGQSRDALLMMLWAVALVLLIACANVANLLLSRAVARQKEMAVRSALGAGRGRLIGQLLTESLLLSFAGGALGLLFAWGGIRLLLSFRSIGLPATNPIGLNPVVLAFTFALVLLTSVLFGIIPALHTSRPQLHDELKGGAGSSVTQGRHRRFASDALVIAEVGLSLLLLISAAVLLKDFVRLRHREVGVRTDGVWTAAVALPKAKYAESQQQLNFAQQLLDKVRHLPGVESAALTDRLPLEGGSNGYIHVRGTTFQPMSGPLVESHSVSPGYLETMGIPLLQGRDFTETDLATTQAVEALFRKLFASNQKPAAEVTNAVTYPAVINQTMARTFWPGQNPLGQMYSRADQNGPWAQVVGVTGDVRQWGLTNPAQPEEYTLLTGDTNLYLVVHTSLAPQAITAEVRGVVTQLDSSLPLFSVRTMQEVIADNASDERFVTTLIGIFSALALVLAAIGIYGVLSYLVTQRTREIGIRISLGASRSNILGLVLGRGMKLALIGFVLGIIGARAAGRVLASVLHDVKPGDPSTFVLSALGLTLVALVACYLPARRAARVDPMQALRTE